jgi:hypothetical protein
VRLDNDIDNQWRGTGIIGISGRSWDIGADQGAQPIYRSIAPGLTTALDTGSADSNNLTITPFTNGLPGATLTTSIATPDNVGVGDAVQYDSDANGSIDAIAFITARASSSQYTVQSRDGGTPPAVTNDQDWAIYRARTTLDNAEGGVENTGLSDTVEHFDIDVSAGDGKDIYTANQQWNIAAYANGTTADTVGVAIDGWTTYPVNYLKVYTPVSVSEVGTSQRHQGKWDTSKYRLSASGWTYGIAVQDEDVRIEGLQMEVTGEAYQDWGIVDYRSAIAYNAYLSQNIIRSDAGTLHYKYGIYIEDIGQGSKFYIHNNLIYDIGDGTSNAHITDLSQLT